MVLSLKLLFFAIFLSSYMVPVVNVFAQSDESELKANWVYTIIPYIKWLDKAEPDITICTIGREPIHTYLKEIIYQPHSEKTDKLFNIKVERKNLLSDFRNCLILYISDSEVKNYQEILRKTQNSNILTISSISGFSKNGGIIEFAIRDDGVILRVNIVEAENSKIVIDSDLLGISEVIDK